MKNIKSIIAITAMTILSIEIGKYFSKFINFNPDEKKSENYAEEIYDLSLRNFHPNKGE